ncbi:hypothetical protein [Variovorax sp.]|uniref:hypothetical protein n=1 Tax=Variovorax sp. TaxID=1871043 RepID=UPI002D652FA1|nr:hypothetical protein [Variovorax sp.]HYP83201.1 hypothetical protein [Variovorax sp.]
MIHLLRCLCICLTAACLGTLARAQATLPTTYVGHVAGAQDPTKTRWLGYWHGQIGALHDVDMKIVVQEISEAGRATLAYSWATTTDGLVTRLVGTIEGDAINVDMPYNKEKLRLTMDPTGRTVKVEFVGADGGATRTSNYWVKGDLAKQPPPTAEEVDRVRNAVIQGNAAHEATLAPSQPPTAAEQAPKELAQWVGLWHGWTGLHKWADIKLSIDRIGDGVLDGSDVVFAQYAYADRKTAKTSEIRLHLVDGALVRELRTGQMTFRMRPSGDAIELTSAYMDHGVESGRYGVLYRVPTTQADPARP